MNEKAKCKNCTNKEEMLEEMAKEIRVALEFGTYENLPIHIKDRVFTGVRFYETAKILLEKYQPKIPEGSVVLTIEEVDEFRKDSAEVKFLKNKIIEQARKETAEEILQEIKLKCKELENKYSHICKSKKECVMETCRYEGVLAVKRELYKLAQKIGVEVEK